MSYAMTTFSQNKQRVLPKNGTIAIVSPSGIIAPEHLQGGVDALKSAGYNVVLMPHAAGPASGMFAATDEERAEDLALALSDPTIDVVWCSRGGYGAIRTMLALPRAVHRVCPELFDPQDPLAIFGKTDKMLVGFSDITVLLSAFVKRGQYAIHGPMLKHISTYGIDAPDVQMTLDLLQGKNVEIPFDPLPGSDMRSVDGLILGGNLSIIESIQRTPLQLDIQQCLLFIEDLNEFLYHIDRMAHNLLFSGFFAKVSGIIVGQMTDMKDGATPFGCTAYDIFSRIADQCKCSIALGFPAGHGKPFNYPILMGSYASYRKGKLFLRRKYAPQSMGPNL